MIKSHMGLLPTKHGTHWLRFLLLMLVVLMSATEVNAGADTDAISNIDEVNGGVINPPVWVNSLEGGRQFSHPFYSRSPLVQRSMVLGGAPIELPQIELAPDGRFNLDEWTLEAWFMHSFSCFS